MSDHSIGGSVPWHSRWHREWRISVDIYRVDLINKNFLNNIIELDENAYKRFLEILKVEGRLEPEFY
ncbi:hypothetical protein ENKO_00430 [Enterobacter kobei]|uniref:Uncharacterized protein n=1 Tax=Enterobacter kobei TaxID=208224 RepID=A0AA86IK35_9ENTR|nr:hypothetical protein ENKO_00430 [Enterobacter kobei]